LLRPYSHVPTGYRRYCPEPVRPRGIRSGERRNLWRFGSCHKTLAARQSTQWRRGCSSLPSLPRSAARRARIRVPARSLSRRRSPDSE
jgi:hypothetical protein